MSLMDIHNDPDSVNVIGPESSVLWFEENPEGSWVWKFEKVGPVHG